MVRSQSRAQSRSRMRQRRSVRTLNLWAGREQELSSSLTVALFSLGIGWIRPLTATRCVPSVYLVFLNRIVTQSPAPGDVGRARLKRPREYVAHDYSCLGLGPNMRGFYVWYFYGHSQRT